MGKNFLRQRKISQNNSWRSHIAGRSSYSHQPKWRDPIKHYLKSSEESCLSDKILPPNIKSVLNSTLKSTQLKIKPQKNLIIHKYLNWMPEKKSTIFKGIANRAKFTILYPIKIYQTFKEAEKYDP